MFHSYLVSLILFLGYAIYYICANDIDVILTRVCNVANDVPAVNWDDCVSDIGDVMWVFLVMYALFVILLKGGFCHILYYYYKEALHRKKIEDDAHAQGYTNLAGDHRGRTNSHGSHKSDDQTKGANRLH